LAITPKNSLPMKPSNRRLIAGALLLSIAILAAAQSRWFHVQPSKADSPPAPIDGAQDVKAEAGKAGPVPVESAVQAHASKGKTNPKSGHIPPPLILDQHPIELKPAPDDEEVTAKFTFTNASAKPLTIVGVKSNCSCLKASLDRQLYFPGTKGSGTATFRVTNFTGRQEKTVYVYSNSPEHPKQEITFILDVPAVVSVEPEILDWQVDEAPTPKLMKIRMLGKSPIRITGVTPTRDDVNLNLNEVTASREYHLTVTPKSTKEATYGSLKIETDSKSPKYARQIVFFRILAPVADAK
jgi:hypothetical protein